jgi:hypothetical protein
MPTGSALRWQMTGFKKSEKLNLFSYAIMFANLTMTQDTYRGVTGENG